MPYSTIALYRRSGISTPLSKQLSSGIFDTWLPALDALLTITLPHLRVIPPRNGHDIHDFGIVNFMLQSSPMMSRLASAHLGRRLKSKSERISLVRSSTYTSYHISSVKNVNYEISFIKALYLFEHVVRSMPIISPISANDIPSKHLYFTIILVVESGIE